MLHFDGSTNNNNPNMNMKSRRGFASMDPVKQREIASKGGRAAHEKGTAHEWTGEEAKEAGRKGGAASHRRVPNVLEQ
jgi:general stress protein YciG